MGFVTKDIGFPHKEQLTVSPRSTAKFFSSSMDNQTVTGMTFQFTSTLNAELKVVLEATIEDANSPWVPQGDPVTIPSNGGTVMIGLGELQKVKRVYPCVRLAITPSTAPTYGTLSGRVYAEW